MKVKKSDIVKILSGKDRGKTGEVLQVFPKTGKILVKGINIVTKHQKSQGQEKPGGRIQFEQPINISKVQIINPENQKPSRVSFVSKDGKKQRVFKNQEKIKPTVQDNKKK